MEIKYDNGVGGRLNCVIPWLARAISERFRYDVLYNNALYKSTLLYYIIIIRFLTRQVPVSQILGLFVAQPFKLSKIIYIS